MDTRDFDPDETQSALVRGLGTPPKLPPGWQLLGLELVVGDEPCLPTARGQSG